jgi:hypothetical protein
MKQSASLAPLPPQVLAARRRTRSRQPALRLLQQQ